MLARLAIERKPLTYDVFEKRRGVMEEENPPCQRRGDRREAVGGFASKTHRPQGRSIVQNGAESPCQNFVLTSPFDKGDNARS